jgi:signal transduction histidine kinase
MSDADTCRVAKSLAAQATSTWSGARGAWSHRLAVSSAGVAHEIRNPIAAVRLKAENAVAAGPDSRRKDDALRVIVEQIGPSKLCCAIS